MSKNKEIAKEAKTRPPVKAERITLDDFVIKTDDGDEFYPHRNEWVDIIPIRQLSSLRNLMKLASFSTGDDTTINNPALIDQYDNLVNYMADVIYDWSLTDENDKPIANPYKNPKVFDDLGLDEINYLVVKLIGGRTDESKSEPSTSS